MKDFFRKNGLTVVTFALFFIFWGAMAVTGFYNYNEQQREEGQATTSFAAYFGTGHFWEATFENWESEFLQMGIFVLLTAFLFQKGSAEAREKQQKEEETKQENQEQKEGKRGKNKQDAPWPIRRGGFVEKLYENSLSIALLSLFVLSFIFHAVSGVREYNQEQAFFHQPPITTWQFLATSEFWFQSFQNWQSEFLAVGAMVVLTIYLRQKGSAESKQVGAPNSQTGD